MFERNIIDLVALFIENVQSLYPFLEDPPCGGVTGAHQYSHASRGEALAFKKCFF